MEDVGLKTMYLVIVFWYAYILIFIVGWDMSSDVNMFCIRK